MKRGEKEWEEKGKGIVGEFSLEFFGFWVGWVNKPFIKVFVFYVGHQLGCTFFIAIKIAVTKIQIFYNLKFSTNIASSHLKYTFMVESNETYFE